MQTRATQRVAPTALSFYELQRIKGQSAFVGAQHAAPLRPIPPQIYDLHQWLCMKLTISHLIQALEGCHNLRRRFVAGK
jgi:hypothetical protein